MPGSLIGTLALLVAFLLTLMLGAATSMFTARAPQGADAMGLAAVFIGMAVRWGLMALAALIVLGRGGFDWVSTRPGVPTAAVLGACVGLAVVFAGSWIQWTMPARAWTVAAGNLGAIVLPIVVQVYLVVALWSPEFGTSAGIARWVGSSLGGIAVPGLIAGLVMLGMWQKEQMARADEVNARAIAESSEFERRAALSNTERLREDLAAMPEAGVFWQVAGYFDQCRTQEERVMVATRLDKVPNLAEEIVANLSCPYASFRNRAAIFVSMIPSPGDGWAKTMIKPIELLAGDIQKAGTLTGPDKEDYAAYCRNLLAASVHFNPASLAAPLAQLRRAVEGTPACPQRTMTLEEIHRFLGGALDQSVMGQVEGIEEGR